MRLPAQTRPQPPQFLRSDQVLTHVPEHAENPVLHLMPHFCWLHVATPFAGVAQTVRQPPQCDGSASTSMHASPQLTSGDAQVKPQVPEPQVGVPPDGAEQLWPHFPQLAVLVERSTHEPSQDAWFALHWTTQAPAEQTRPVGQTVSHAPQCAESDVRSTQAPPQFV